MWAMTSMRPCDIIMTLHCLHCDIMLTFFWPCCVNSVATPILPCSPIRKPIHDRLWVESSVSGVIRCTLIHVPASSPRIRPTCSGSGFPRPATSTPGLCAHSFPGPMILFWWITWPRLGLEGCDAAIQVSRTQHGSPQTVPALLFMSLSGELMKKKSTLNIFWPFDLLYWWLCLLLLWNLKKGFSFTWISCLLWPRLELVEDQYKQSTNAVTTHSNLSPRLWTGSLLSCFYENNVFFHSLSLSNTHTWIRMHAHTLTHTQISTH